MTESAQCSGLASFAFPEAKSSQTGVSVRYVHSPEKQWYVFRIKYGQAKKVSDFLIDSGVYSYLAMVWKDVVKEGKRRRVLLPFLNLLFVYVTEEEAREYVNNSAESHFITYYYDHFSIGPDGKNPPLTIMERDIKPLIRATSLRDVHVMEVDLKKLHFDSNDLVLVTDGPFKGIYGRVARIARQKRVVIQMKGLNSGITTAYIPPYCLKKVEPSE